ncbi:four-helix bundle copper-binding protein [Salinimonas marina]|uniref:Four-helix bundle copper-binding protein n=1 Tax=Salinimonas marina TaxID=2785918 RepID=A0A7S9HEV8_9ALTE|nr:four-helix bundle copper-binding protein [Salinimonas marina]
MVDFLVQFAGLTGYQRFECGDACFECLQMCRLLVIVSRDCGMAGRGCKG